MMFENSESGKLKIAHCIKPIRLVQEKAELYQLRFWNTILSFFKPYAG
jgi:hypothetical protein